ncbi:MAG: hypothetical protein JRH20_18580, partial [Deltaproteobacteria bacterium]|nr:hypothetical protein [Deltaproteobacteria bacterium]
QAAATKEQAATKQQLSAAKQQLEVLRKQVVEAKPSVALDVKVKKLEESLESAKKLAETRRRDAAECERQMEELEAKQEGLSTKVGVKDPQQALKDVQAELQVARTETKRTKLRVVQLEEELADVQEEDPTKVKSMTTVVDDERERIEQASGKEQAELKEQLAAMDTKLRKLDEVENARVELARENDGLRDKITELKELEKLSDELEGLKLEATTLKRKSEESERLRDEKAGLSEQLQVTERERQDLESELTSFRQAQDDRTDLSLKINVLSEQLRDLERMREENLQLKSRTEQFSLHEQEMADLREENDGLRSLGLIKSAVPKPMLDKGGDEGLGNALQRMLGRLTSEHAARAAVLADELGLVVAGLGEDADAMAAVSALFTEINAKIRGVLPLGTLRQLTLTDENELTFAAQPFSTASGDLVLATLLPGNPPDWKQVDKWVSAALEE